jgi:hypothetical protein
VQTFLAKAFPDNVAEEEKMQYLEKVIQITIKAWPHSWPKTSRDYTNRWWLIGHEEVSSLKKSINWIQNNLPICFERVPQLFDLSTDDPFIKKASYMFDLICEKKEFKNRSMANALFALVLVTLHCRGTGRALNYHPFFEWAEIRKEFGNALREIIVVFEEFKIFEKAPIGTHRIYTFLGLHVIPSNFETSAMILMRSYLIENGFHIQEDLLDEPDDPDLTVDEPPEEMFSDEEIEVEEEPVVQRKRRIYPGVMHGIDARNIIQQGPMQLTLTRAKLRLLAAQSVVKNKNLP